MKGSAFGFSFALKAPPPSLASVPKEARLKPVVRRLKAKGGKSAFRDARRETQAAKMLDRLPSRQESVHLALDGSFDLGMLIPRIIELAGEQAEALDLATLGFNDATIMTLGRLSDEGKVGRVRLLCSHYFKSVDAELWSRSNEAMAKRGHEVYIARNHAKLQLYRFASGRLLTLMSSANLRTCRSAETAVLFADPAVHGFWSGVVGELIDEAKRCREKEKRSP